VLEDVLAGLKPGDKATVTLLRADGTTHDVTVTLGNLRS
jgi:S1-C subfamily serine protease